MEKGRTLRSEVPIFLSAVAGCMDKAASTFNKQLGLSDDGGITISHSGASINVTSRTRDSGVVFIRSIIHSSETLRVVVTTQTIKDYGQSVSRSEMLFDVSDAGVVLLNGKNYHEIAAEFFRDATVYYA